MFDLFAFTLRKTKNPFETTYEDYIEHIARIQNTLNPELIKFLDIVFEKSSGLHCHGVLKIHIEISKNRLRYRGWRLHISPIYDKQLWDIYCNKDQKNLLPDMIDPPDDDFVWPKKKLF